MSYIKTREGRILEENALIRASYDNDKSWIAQTSDKIEPLFEHFILIDRFGNNKIVDVCFDEKSGKYRQKDYGSANKYRRPKRGEHLYGATWYLTNLIAQARLNNKGEWELL